MGGKKKGFNVGKGDLKSPEVALEILPDDQYSSWLVR